MKKLNRDTEILTGIYKITNPQGKVYIGQSIDIKRRFKEYCSTGYSNSQPKLINSLNKYGPERHKFTVLEECEAVKLNERERYWQERFNVLEEGLNCKLTQIGDKSGVLSEETKKKIGIKSQGRKGRLGKKHTKETKEKMRLAALGRKHSKKTKEKIGKKSKGRKHSPETLQKLSEIRKEIWRVKNKVI